jgi:hypothetical protein
MFKFQAVLARTQPFLSRSVRNGATNPDSNAEKWSIIMQFAVGKVEKSVVSAHRICSQGGPKTQRFETR